MSQGTVQRMRDGALSSLANRAVAAHGRIDMRFDRIERALRFRLHCARMLAHLRVDAAVDRVEQQRLDALQVLAGAMTGCRARGVVNAIPAARPAGP